MTSQKKFNSVTGTLETFHLRIYFNPPFLRAQSVTRQSFIIFYNYSSSHDLFCFSDGV